MTDFAQAKKLAVELGLDKPDVPVSDLPDDGEDYGMTGEHENVVITRGIAVITDEIVFYKNVGGNAIIEIGKRLNEAKSQLSHGEWLDWLEEKVDFSERTAQNFMRIAKKYKNPHTIADLGTSKALTLLALPDSEREQFAAEKHLVNGEEKSVADMTGEELKKAIRERDEALTAQKEAQEGLDDMVDKLSDAQRERDEALSKLDEAKQAGEQAATAKLDALKVKSEGLEEKLKTARAKEKEAQAELEKAKAEKAELEKNLEELRNKPVDVAVQQPGEEDLKKLREEAEAAAAEKVKAAQAQADAADRAVEELRRQLAAADKDTQTFKFFFDEWRQKYNAMMGALQVVEATNPEKAEKLKKAIGAAAERMGAAG